MPLLPSQTVVERLPIPLFESVVLAVRGEDTQIYVSLPDLCAALEITLAAQRRRIIADDALHLVPFRIGGRGNQVRTVDCLLLDDLSLWLLGVQRRKVREAVRERFTYVQQYLQAAVRRAFAELADLPSSESSAIEDLADLDRIEQAFTALASLDTRQENLEQRQGEIEASQDRARVVFRDMQRDLADVRARLRSLEQQLHARLSPTQRNTLYRMVEAWANARAAAAASPSTPGSKIGPIIQRCWREFNARFGIATYTDLNAGRLDEAVAFLKAQYKTLTGTDLVIDEQQGLDFDV